jgi:hypothetical protein
VHQQNRALVEVSDTAGASGPPDPVRRLRGKEIVSRGTRWTQEQADAAQARAMKRTNYQSIGGPAYETFAAVEPAKKTPKYRNVRVTDEEGITHDSKKELKRWKELRLMLKMGTANWIARQADFHLPGMTVYRADFMWMDTAGKIHVEDVKSEPTRKLPAYRIKIRQLKELHGFTVEEK